MSDIEDCLKDILINDIFVELGKDRILATASLREDIGLDSLGFIELKSRIEKCFSIIVSDEDFTPENFSTISSVTSMINRYRGLPGYAIPETAGSVVGLGRR